MDVEKLEEWWTNIGCPMLVTKELTSEDDEAEEMYDDAIKTDELSEMEAFQLLIIMENLHHHTA